LTETIIGRAPNSGLVLADSQISRQHAKLLWMNGHHVLEDMNSANGTFVRGVKIAQQRLNPGDVIHFGSGFAYRYTVMDDTEKKLMEQLYQQSVLDALTGAYNREYFDTVLTAELEKSKKTATSLSLLLLDIDHFKRVNDTYGHAAGDAVLTELVQRIQLRLGPSDVACRFGGEEFAVILRGADLPAAARLAERLRQAVSKQKFVYAQTSMAVTLSIGCASDRCCGEARSVEELTAIADRRLYAAKRAGRNRVVDAD
jgi:diguanylate cyclase (GGDEF)-like protein